MCQYTCGSAPAPIFQMFPLISSNIYQISFDYIQLWVKEARLNYSTMSCPSPSSLNHIHLHSDGLRMQPAAQSSGLYLLVHWHHYASPRSSSMPVQGIL